MSIFRLANADDVHALRDVHEAAYRDGFIEFIGADALEAAIEVRCSLERWTTIMDEAPGKGIETLVDDSSGRLVGFVQYGPEATSDEDPVPAADQWPDGWTGEHVGEIHRMYVAPDSWGTGVAVALMGEALGHMSQAGYEWAKLWAAGNPRARRFYEKTGFVATGVDRHFEIVPGRSVSDHLYYQQLA